MKGIKISEFTPTQELHYRLCNLVRIIDIENFIRDVQLKHDLSDVLSRSESVFGESTMISAVCFLTNTRPEGDTRSEEQYISDLKDICDRHIGNLTHFPERSTSPTKNLVSRDTLSAYAQCRKEIVSVLDRFDSVD